MNEEESVERGRKDEKGKCFQIVLHVALISQEVRGMKMETDREVNWSDFISAVETVGSLQYSVLRVQTQSKNSDYSRASSNRRRKRK